MNGSKAMIPLIWAISAFFIFRENRKNKSLALGTRQDGNRLRRLTSPCFEIIRTACADLGMTKVRFIYAYVP
ncbi:hypothetical protein [[Scytonema hofmanni] UTEX B 1581]|uniref:hypothetical protein n=1 Tax=[Scytonema hofmanni] UTEX B 1581 TaxID=379535 RepID=UPI001640F8A3|nr:hypothetical protein [[Scytonema hofmanni] UTEX B 1581]